MYLAYKQARLYQFILMLIHSCSRGAAFLFSSFISFIFNVCLELQLTIVFSIDLSVDYFLDKLLSESIEKYPSQFSRAQFVVVVQEPQSSCNCVKKSLKVFGLE